MKTTRKLQSLLLSVCWGLTIILFAFCATGCESKMQTTENETYTLYTDFAYGKDERQKADISIPKNKSGDVGLIFLIHGGGWISGDKEVFLNEHARWCGEKGYVSVALNYRYASKKVHVADILDDITSCLMSVKVFASERGVAVTKMLLAGGSAGAHLSLLYAYQKADISPIKPVAVCSFSGPTDLTDEAFWLDNPIVDGIINMVSPLLGVEFTAERYQAVTPFLKQASPVLYASKISPPTLILHGVLDEVVPYSNAVRLHERLTQLGVSCDFLSYPNSGHGLESDPELSAQADKLMIEYAETYLV